MSEEINNPKEEKVSLFSLFTAFAKIGLFTFGGGLAMFPMLEREVVKNHGWATEEEIVEMFAIGQCTPGIIMINEATFIGYKHRRVPGAIASTLGAVFPSLVIILLIATILTRFKEIEEVAMAFAGIRVAVSAMVTKVVLKLVKSSIIDWKTAVFFVIGALLLFLVNVSPVYVVLLGIVLGLLFGKAGREVNAKVSESKEKEEDK